MSCKVLISADLHIKDYGNYNKSQHSRLNQFIDLANMMQERIKQDGIKFVAIAGDFLDESKPSPLAYNTARKFLKIISDTSVEEIYIVSGNHDINSKSEILEENTYCSSFDIPKVKYVHNKSLTLGGRVFHFRGWEPELKDIPRCEVLISHAFIDSATLTTGFQVRGNKVEGDFKIAFIGDIHKHQVIGKVVIPGTPLQNSFSDDPDTGYIILDTKDLSWERVSTAKSSQFVKFRYEEDLVKARAKYESLEKTDDHPSFERWMFDTLGVVVKPTPKEVSNVAIDVQKMGSLDLNEILDGLLRDFEFRDELFACLGKNSKKMDSFINQELKVNLKSIKIENFKSIKDVTLDFTQLNKLAVFTGDNGSGKSSFFEAIIWALTGNSPADVDDVIRSGQKGCEVTLKVEYQGKEIVIERSRGSKFELNVIVGGIALTAHNKSDMQNRLVEVLPVVNKLHLLYFNQSRDGILSELNDASRVSLISELSGQSVVAELSVDVEEKVTTLKAESEKAEQNFSSVISKLEGLRAVYTEVEDPSDKIEKLEVRAKTVVETIQKQTAARSCIVDSVKDEVAQKNQDILKKQSGLVEQIRVFTPEKDKLNERIRHCNNIIKKEPFWKCDRCGTTIKAENFNEKDIEDAKQEKDDALKRLSEIEIEVTQINKQVQECDKEKQIINHGVSAKLGEVTREIDEELKTLREKETAIRDGLNKWRIQLGQYNKSLEIKEKIKTLEDSRNELETERDRVKHKFDVFKDINNRVFGTDGLLAASVLDKLAKAINRDENIRIVTTKVLKNGKVKPTLSVDLKVGEYFQPYNRLSGGQRLLVDLYLLMKIIEVVNGIGMLALDEILKYADFENAEKMFKMLQESSVQNVLLVYHGEIPDSLTGYSHVKVSRGAGHSNYQIVNC